VKRAPRPGTLASSTLPWWASAIALTMASPSPPPGWAAAGSPLANRFDGLAPGIYQVELRFAELQRTRPNTHLFDVILENSLALPAHDIALESAASPPTTTHSSSGWTTAAWTCA
jgi:hypothetical protein